jgi:YD repeat-containing protein
MTDPLGSTSYAYDNLNRLTSVTRGSDTVGYSYDPAGNRIGITYPGGLQVSYTFNDVNLPETISDSVYQTAISYNEIGNKVQEVFPNGITANFQYDSKGV